MQHTLQCSVPFWHAEHWEDNYLFELKHDRSGFYIVCAYKNEQEVLHDEIVGEIDLFGLISLLRQVNLQPWGTKFFSTHF